MLAFVVDVSAAVEGCDVAALPLFGEDVEGERDIEYAASPIATSDKITATITTTRIQRRDSVGFSSLDLRASAARLVMVPERWEYVGPPVGDER